MQRPRRPARRRSVPLPPQSRNHTDDVGRLDLRFWCPRLRNHQASGSKRQVVGRNDEFVAFTGSDYQMALSSGPDLATDRDIEESVLEAIHNKHFQMVERL